MSKCRRKLRTKLFFGFREKGLFNRVPGGLLFKIHVDPGRQNLPGVSEYFYQVTVIPG